MRKSPTFLSRLSLALFAAFILGAATSAKAQTVTTPDTIWNWTTTSSANWETPADWTRLDLTTGAVTTNSGFPRGAGDIVNIMADLASGTTTITLTAPEMVGFLSIGDVNGNNGNYLIQNNGTSTNTLTFDGGGLGRATLQNFVSNAGNPTITPFSTISANIVLNNVLDVNEGLNGNYMTTLSGNISVLAGSGAYINKIGGGALKLTGTYTPGAGSPGLVVSMRGFGDAGTITNATQNSNIIFANSGVANAGATVLFGNLTVGNASRGGTGSAVVTFDFNNQLSASTVVSFDGVSGSNPYFKLAGTTQQMEGLQDYDGQGFIENSETEAISTGGIMNIGTTGFNSFNGVIRDKNNTGTGTISINVSGTGIQVLSGGSITYTGNTTDSGGAWLRLIQTTAFNSNITVTSASPSVLSTLELQATGTWNFGSFQNGTVAATAGTGHDITFGANGGNLIISGPSNLNVNQNVMVGGGGTAANLTVLPNTTTANTFTFNGGKNFFNNFNFLSPYLPSLNTFTTVQFQSEAPQESGTITGNTITMTATSGILVGMTATGPSGSLGTVTGVTSTTVTVSGAGTGTGTFSFEGSSESFAGSATIIGPYAAVDLQAPTTITGTLTIDRSKFTVEPSANVTTIAGGTLTAGAINLGGSTLDTIFTISNNASTGSQSTGDRVNSAPITSNGGQIVYGGDTTTSHSETLGTLALTSGDLEITTSGVTSGTETLAFGALTRSVGSTITFSNTGIGATTNEVTFSGQAAGFMGGWATVSSTTIAGGLEFANYVAGTGVTALSSYSINSYSGNVKLTSATSPGSGTVTINSLNIQSTGALVIAIPSGGKLVVTSGGILDDGASHTINGPGTLTATGGSDLIPTVASAEILTIGAIIADNGTAVGLTKAGIGRLALTGTANTFTGAVYLNEGDLQIASAGSLGTTNTSALNFDGGSLSLNANGITISRTINLGPGGGQIGVANSATGTFSGAITGTGVFTFINNYQASSSASSGTLNVTGSNLNFAGGLETNNGISTSGGTSSQTSGNFLSVLNVTGSNDTFGHLRIDGSTVNIGVNGTTTDTITGDLVMSSGTLNLFGTNTMTGTTGTSTGPNIFVAGGALVLQSGGALGAATSSGATVPTGYTNFTTTNPGLTVTGTAGQITLNGFNLMINILTGSGAFFIDDGGTTGKNETLYVNTVASTTYSGLITDEYDANVNPTGTMLNFTKMGSGNLTLGVNANILAVNNYNGVTSIQGGVLTVTSLAAGGDVSSIGASSNAAGNLLIGNGAALAFAGTTESFTDRSFTITTSGSDAASIIADGTSRDAIIHFGDDQSVTPGASKVAYAAGIVNQAVTLTLGGFNQGDNSFNEVLTNNGTGVVSLDKIGNGTWLLTENNNPTTGPLAGTGYTGLTQISGGSLAVTVDGALGSPTGGTILEGGASTQSFTVGGVLDFRNVNYTTPEPLFMEGGELAATTGISTFTGPINVSLASTVQIFDNTSLTLSGPMSGVGSINQLGQGTLVLSGNNSARTSTLAAWTVQAGELELDYSGDIATKLSSNGGQPFHKLTFIAGTTPTGAALTLGGSRLGGEIFVNDGTTASSILRTTITPTGTVQGGGTFAEFFSGLTLNAGENQIVNSQPTAWFNGTGGTNINNDTVSTVIMVLNNITVASGATLNLNEPGIAVTTKTNIGAGLILGAWATIGQNDWAISSANNNFFYDGDGLPTTSTEAYIVGLSDRTGGTGYVNDTWSGGNPQTTGGSNNVNVTLSSTQGTNQFNISTLRYNTPSASPIVVTLTQPLNYISSGGIMVTTAVGATDVFLTGSTLQAGTGTGSGTVFANQDFIIYQYNTAGKFVIGSTIQNNNFGGTDGLNKLGAGTLVLTGANTYTGTNTLSNGYVSINTLGPAGFAAATGIASTDVLGFNVVYGDTAGLTIGQSVTAGTGISGTTITAILDPYHYVVSANATSSNTATSATFSATTLTGTFGGAYSSTTVAGSNEITVAGTIGVMGAVGVTDGVVIGQAISGVGIPEGSYVTGILDSTHILISSAATASGTNTLNYATGASGIGAATNGGINSSGTPTPTIVLNGGTLQYTGQTALTDRALTLNFDAQISVTDPNTTLTMSNIIITGSNIGDYTLAKVGEGTLRFTDATATSASYGVTGYLADQGRLQLVSAFGNDRYARNDVATLTVAGGAFEFIGDTIASRSQALPGQFSIGVGEGQVEVTSQVGVTTTLTLQSASSPLIISRAVGGTVQFVENPGVSGGLPTAANLVINTISFNTQVPIPYAVYEDTTLNTDIGKNSQPGFNDFAAIDGQTGNVVAASTINGAFFVASSELASATDPNKWGLLGSSPPVSEGSFSFNTSGPTEVTTDIHASVIRYFANSTSVIDLGGINSTTGTFNTLAVDQGGILLAEAIGHNSKIIQNGNLTSGAGDLIIQNYNYSAPFQIKANIVNNSLGNLALAFNETTSVEVLSVANFSVGQAVQGTYTDGNNVTHTNFFPAGTIIKAINPQTEILVLSNPVVLPGDSTPGDEKSFTLVYNQAIGLTQAGQSVTKTIGQTAISTIKDIGSTSTTAGSANILQLNNGSTTAGLVVGMTISGVGIPLGTTIVSINAGADTVTMSANATSTNPTLGITFIQFATTSSTLAGVGTTILSGTNTYTGSTYIEGGVLRLDSVQAIPGGIGATGGTSAIILDGGQIGIDTNSGSFLRGVGSGASQVQFLGSGGFTAYGSPLTPLVVNLGGAGTPTQLTWGATSGFLNDDSILILSSPDSDSTINFENPIALGPLTRVVRTDNGTNAVDAMLSGVLSSDGGGLIKTGYGTLELTAVNTYTGGTTVAAGNLYALNPATAFGTGPVGLGNTTDSDIDDNVTLTLGAGTTATTNAVTVGSVNSTGVSVIASASTTAAIGGTVSLERDTFLNAPTGDKLTLSGVVSGVGGITVIGGGDVYLTTANTYGTSGGAAGSGINGGTIIRSGTIHVVNNAAALGATTVELGDVIKVLTPVSATTNSISVTMQGGTFDPTPSLEVTGIAGAFFNVSNTVNGTTFTTAQSDAVAGAGNGARILVKDDSGNPERNGIYEVISVTLGVTNADGSTTAGTMDLARVTDFGNPVNGGTGITTFNMTYGSQVTDSSTGITYFMASGSVNNVNQPDADPTAWLVDNANPNVALVTDTGSLTITNNVDVNNTNGTGTSTIGGSSALTTGSSTFSGAITLQDLTPGTPASKTLLLSSFTSTGNGIIFTGLISEANSADDTLAIQTAGPSTGAAGVVTLNQTNTYHGTTTVSANTILRPLVGTGTVVSGTGTSALGYGDSTAATGTIVNSGGELQLTGGLTFSTEDLTLSGVGNTTGGGALHNTSGINNWGGPIVVGTGGATIAADTGTTLNLNLNSASAISGNFPLTFNSNGTINVTGGIIGSDNITATGTGTTNLNGVIGTGASSVTMNGTGALVLTAANTYTGATTVNSGILQIQNSQALGLGGDGTQATGTTVNTGGELQFNGSTPLTLPSTEGIFLNGSGLAGAGAVNVLSGTGTINGPVTLQSATTVSTNTGASLVIGTNTTNNHPNITASGTGATLTTIGAGTTTIVDAIDTGTGGLTVSSGTTVLNNPTANPSTYSGATTVSGGANLQVGVLGIGSTGTGGGGTQVVSVTGTSPTNVGTLSGTGTVNGATTIGSNGVLAPGDTGGTSLGTLNFGTSATHGSLTLNSGSTTTLQVSNTSLSQLTLTFDKINVTGTLALTSGGEINVMDAGGFVANAFANETIDLLNWTSVTQGTFSVGTNLRNGGNGTGDLSLPTLSGNLVYDVSKFISSDGLITIVNAPEPSRILLITSGLALMMMRRRRRAV